MPFFSLNNSNLGLPLTFHYLNIISVSFQHHLYIHKAYFLANHILKIFFYNNLSSVYLKNLNITYIAI